MDKEDFKQWLANDFGCNGLASGNYCYEDFADVRNLIYAIYRSGLGFAELSSLADIAGDITDDEDLKWICESLEEIKLDLLERAIR